MHLPITMLLTGIFALLMVALSLQVSFRRLALKTELGDGNDEILRRRVRAHGNFTEYAPTGLIILAMVEYARTASVWVVTLAAILLATRLLHAYGILFAPRSQAKPVAIMTQHAAFLVAGCWLIFAAILQ